MDRLLLGSVGIAVFLGLVACSEKSPKLSGSNQKSSYNASQGHGGGVVQLEAPTGLELVEVIKRKTLPDFQTSTIGQVFQEYDFFTRQEWTQMRSANGTFYVDCIGWLDARQLDSASTKNGITKQGVGFKFMIARDGTFGLVMVSRIDEKIDGKMYSYPLEDTKSFIAKIYGKKEIKF